MEVWEVPGSEGKALSWAAGEALQPGQALLAPRKEGTEHIPQPEDAETTSSHES